MEYKVKALTVSGLGKKIHRNGDVVTEKDFPQGRVKELVNSGFLVEVSEKNIEVKTEKNVEKVSENILEQVAKTTKKSGKK
jgi:GTPase SAR1 family protein